MSVTTLLHEAYLDMSGREDTSFPDQARFMGYASRVMRGLIIDHARSRSAIKRGSEFEITSLEIDVAENPVDDRELSLISDALDRLAKVEPELKPKRSPSRPRSSNFLALFSTGHDHKGNRISSDDPTQRKRSRERH